MEGKRARKPRKPNKLTNDTFKIIKIAGKGVPVKDAKGFSNAEDGFSTSSQELYIHTLRCSLF